MAIWDGAQALKLESPRQGRSTMQKCPNMGDCTIFPLLNLSGTLKTWQERYCSGAFDTCERYKKTLKGLPVAPDLMPNGVRLADRNK